jgi:hypothetical protein
MSIIKMNIDSYPSLTHLKFFEIIQCGYDQYKDRYLAYIFSIRGGKWKSR